MSRFSKAAVYSFLALLSSFCLPLLSQTLTIQPQPVDSGRPVLVLRQALAERYGKVVTYEETLLSFGQDLTPQGDKGDLVAKNLRFVIPGEADPKADYAIVAQRGLDAYLQQTSGPRYRLAQSALGLHLIPAEVRDASGRFIPAVNILDAQITIPQEVRTPTDHLRALLAALTNATRVNIKGPVKNPKAFDQHFSVEPESFLWGVTKPESARDALIDFLGRSATTYTWGLGCQNAVQEENRYCRLDIGGVATKAVGPGGKLSTKALEWDRCPKCSPHP